MDNRIDEFYEQYLNSLKSGAPAYGLLYFDHLYSEYMAIRSSVNQDEQQLMDGIHKRRTDDGSPLTWGDIYLFDMELLKWLPPEALLSKAYDMRSRYRNVAGEKEYELYIASKPPDLSAAKVAPGEQAAGEVIPTAQPAVTVTPAEEQAAKVLPPAPPKQKAGQLEPAVELALREDIKYLLKVFYLDYSLMKVREGVREQLMRKGTKWTLWALAAIAVFIILNSIGSKVPHDSRLYIFTRGLTVGVVLAAGCVGGLMSMLQRIQSAPSEGDALFNLASLTNGWRSIFLAPLTGAVFSVLLFVLFAAGVLKGTVFPDIYTPSGRFGSITQIRQSASSPESTPTPSPTQSVTPTHTPTPPPSEAPSGTPAPTPRPTSAVTPATNTSKPTPLQASTKSPVATPAASASPSSSPSPTPVATDSRNAVAFSDFIQQTGPTSGINYALLIVWSFIAGFAERLVPDALSKLVAKSNTGT